MSKSVVLNPKRNQSFRRGEFVFSPGHIVELSDSQLWDIRKDVGHALLPAYLDDKGHVRIVEGEVKIEKPVKRRKKTITEGDNK